jgi:hypothetical protein
VKFLNLIQMKQGTLVWVLAEVSEYQETNTVEGTIIVEPQGTKALPYYAPTELVKQLTQVEIDEMKKAEMI